MRGASIIFRSGYTSLRRKARVPEPPRMRLLGRNSRLQLHEWRQGLHLRSLPCAHPRKVRPGAVV